MWEYRWWNLSFGGVWLIFFFGYFHFCAAAILVLSMKTARARVLAVASLYGVAVGAKVVGLGVLGRMY